jgi:hypothetical protein
VGGEPSGNQNGDGQVLEIKVGEEVLRLTPSEVAQRLERAEEKEKGADAKFRSAADERKSAEQDRKKAEYLERVVQDIAASNKGDLEASRRLPTYSELGVTAEQIEAVIQANKEAEEAEKGGKGSKGAPAGPPKKWEIDDFSPQVQTVLRAADEERKRRAVQEVYDQLRTSVDKDTDLHNILKGGENKKIAQLVRRLGEEELKRRVQRDGAPNAQMYQDVVSTVKEQLLEIGVPVGGKGGDQFPGLGPAPYSAPTSQLQPPKEPPKERPKTSDPAYGDYVKRLLQYELSKAQEQSR